MFTNYKYIKIKINFISHQFDSQQTLINHRHVPQLSLNILQKDQFHHHNL